MLYYTRKPPKQLLLISTMRLKELLEICDAQNCNYGDARTFWGIPTLPHIGQIIDQFNTLHSN